MHDDTMTDAPAEESGDAPRPENAFDPTGHPHRDEQAIAPDIVAIPAPLPGENDDNGEEPASPVPPGKTDDSQTDRDEGEREDETEETPDSATSETDEAEEEEESGDDEEQEDAAAPDLPALPIASVVEAILFAAREPLKPAHIARAVGKRTRQDAVKTAIDELNVHYLESGRAFEIAEISGRYQLMSRPEYVNHIMRIYPKKELAEKDRVSRLTPATLDTLAIIAYKQPVTRGEIEHIRGVGCGPVLRALIERGSVKVAGKRSDLVGQPLMYGTTEAFLAEFGLGSLDELPLRNEFISVMGEMEAVREEEAETAGEPGASAETVPEASPETEQPADESSPAPDGETDGDAVADGEQADETV